MEKKRTTIYQPSELWNKFLETCTREGESASIKIEGWIDEYMSVHGEGNPQTMLDYAEQVKCLPKWKTCTGSGGKMVKGDFYCKTCNLWINPKICESRNNNLGCYKVKII